MAAAQLSRRSPMQPRRPRAAITTRGILVHRDRFLFMRAQLPGREWFILPGGHVEHRELLEDALRREMLEETGIHVIVERPLFLREYIAARHNRRPTTMPEHHHVLALLFLCTPDPARHDIERDVELGEFPGQIDDTTTIKGLAWLTRAEIAEAEIMPPHIKRALLQPDFPPPAGAGIQWWPDTD